MALLEAIHARQTLTISTVPTFAASWLVPRLGRFTERHADIAIRHGLGEYPGLVSRPLAAPVLLPVACPAPRETRPSRRSCAGCRRRSTPRPARCEPVMHAQKNPAFRRGFSYCVGAWRVPTNG